MREHLKSNIEKIVFINGAGAEIRTRVPGSTVPEDDRLPYPGIYLRQQVLSLSPLASRAPPLIKVRIQETIKNLNNFKMLRPGFEPESSARKAEMIGRTTPPEQNTYEFS